jgi:hypothetical protein
MFKIIISVPFNILSPHHLYTVAYRFSIVQSVGRSLAEILFSRSAIFTSLTD